MADIRFYNKLDKGQLINLLGRKEDFIRDFTQRTGLGKKELGEVYDDAVIRGNVRGTKWSKFVGSLQKNEGKLLLRNNDPFRGYFKQAVDLAKKEHLEPVINEIEKAQESLKQRKIDDFKAGTKDPKMMEQHKRLYTRLQDEIDWYEDLKNMYKRTPSHFDKMITDAAETAFTGSMKQQALKVVRKWGDNFTSVQALAKLGFNIPASIANVIEAVTHGLPHFGAKEYQRLFKEFNTKNPVQIMKEVVKETENNPRFRGLMYTHDVGTGLDTAFTSSSKYFGSKVLGGFKDVFMYPFSKSTTMGKLLSYKLFKTLGEQQGFKGQGLDDFVLTQMTRNKVLPELDRIPAQAQTQVGKVGLLLQTYLVRVTDLASQHYKSALTLPSAENINTGLMQ
jgi:hypothetical protein